MIWPSAETLEIAVRTVATALVSPEALSQVETILTSLPDAFSAHYLECHLATGSARVDFLTCAFASDGGRDLLAANNNSVVPPLHWRAHPIWQQVQRFLTVWADPTSPLYQQVPLIWLEFDQVHGPPPPVSLPSFHFCLDQNFLLSFTLLPSAHLFLPTRKQLAMAGLQCLFDLPLPVRLQQQLVACFDALPPGCNVVHLSTMLARQPAVVKVNILVDGTVSVGQLLAYLQQVGWSGSLVQLEETLRTFRAVGVAVIVDFALGDAVDPRLGLAFSQSIATTQLAEDRRLSALLEQCVASGLCTVEKQAAIMAWPGAAREKYSCYERPALFRRWVDIKLICHADGTLAAKAYLGFMSSSSLF